MKYCLGLVLILAACVGCSLPADVLAIDIKKLPAKGMNLDNIVKMPKELNGFIDGLRDFFIGVWDGINGTFQYDLRYIMWTYYGPGRFIKVWAKLGAVIEEFLKTWDFSKLYNTLSDMVLRTVVHLLPMYMLYNLVDHFIELVQIFIDQDWDELQNRIMITVISNLQLFFGDIQELFGCLGTGDFHCVGENVGQIIYVLIFH